jgi:hypothetical protein
MNIDTEYALKLFFPTSLFKQVYFEAVANAIDASATNISIKVHYHKKDIKNTLKIEIIDDGVGFTDDRFERFSEVKTPQDDRHKGLGRLIYLKYFSTVNVKSVFNEENVRTFIFSSNYKGESKIEKIDKKSNNGTIITLKNFNNHKLQKMEHVSPSYIKDVLNNEFMPTLYEKKIKGEKLTIKISSHLEDDNQSFNFEPEVSLIELTSLQDLKTFQDENIDLVSSITTHYIINKDQSSSNLSSGINIDGRSMPITFPKNPILPDNVTCLFIFKSDVFNIKVDASRQKIQFANNDEKKLMSKLKSIICKVLQKEFPEIKEKNTQQKEKMENNYPHLIGFFEEDYIGILDFDDAIENAQKKFFLQQKSVLNSTPDNEQVFEKSLELAARSLTEYILYREWVIRRLENINDTQKECEIHNLIVPQRNNFTQSNISFDFYRNNAWILDDKFMTYKSIFSEYKMKDIIAAITSGDAIHDEGRPDISIIFSDDPDNVKVDSIIIELKRRKLDTKESMNVVNQLIERAQKLATHCPNIQRVWYYGIIEIDPELQLNLTNLKWAPIYSKGCVLYQEFSVLSPSGARIPVPTFLMSFDAVVKDASAKNHAFLELLKSKFKNNSQKAFDSELESDIIDAEIEDVASE